MAGVDEGQEQLRERCVMRHRFEVGQAVVPAHPRRDCCHVYYIVQLIPETSYEPQYRIQEVKSGITCVVAEADIKVAEAANQAALIE